MQVEWPLRLHKFIALTGYASRREAERLIASGKVTVNGDIVEPPVSLLQQSDVVAIDGETLTLKAETTLLLWHKPKNVMVSRKDPEGRMTIYDLLPKKYQHLHYVGRLDYNSEGLLLLTNNGDLSQYLQKPAHQLKRHYQVRARGVVTDALFEAAQRGVQIDDIRYRPFECNLLRPERHMKKPQNYWFNVVLTEGKNREIRRIFEHFNLQVNRLIRHRFGFFALGQLMPGDYMHAPQDKLDQLLLEVTERKK